MRSIGAQHGTRQMARLSPGALATLRRMIATMGEKGAAVALGSSPTVVARLDGGTSRPDTVARIEERLARVVDEARALLAEGKCARAGCPTAGNRGTP